MKIKTSLVAVAALCGGLYGVAQANLALTNTSPFYLEIQNGSPANCGNNGLSYIAPGATATISGYCGYDICAANNFNMPDIQPGCAEPAPYDKTLSPNNFADGGYAAYVGIGSYNTTSATCAVGASTQAPSPVAFVPFICNLPVTPGVGGNPSTGSFSLNYQSITQEYSATNGSNTQGSPVVLPAITQYTTNTPEMPFFKGVNVSGLEYDGTFLDALFQHPDVPDVLYFAQQGMNLIRLPIRAEFVVVNPTTDITAPGPVNSTYADFSAGNYTANTMYLNAVYDTVQKYLAQGMSVDLDLHNYMRFCDTGPAIGQWNEPTNAMDPNYNVPGVNTKECNIITAPQLAEIWTTILNTPINIPTVDPLKPVTGSFAALAQQYPADNTQNPSSAEPGHLVFGVMNEPYSDNDGNPTTSQIFTDEITAAKVIRQSAPSNLILLSGNGWDPLHAWLPVQVGPNAGQDPTQDSVQFTRQNILNAGLDPSNVAIEVHQYFDFNYSGTHAACNHYTNYTAFENDMNLLDKSGNDAFGAWMATNQMPVMLTEFGASYDASTTGDCVQDMKWMLQYVNQDTYNTTTHSGFIGWTAWRTNRNLPAFNSLQAANPYVYSGTGSTGGIVQGPGNAMMPILMAPPAPTETITIDPKLTYFNNGANTFYASVGWTTSQAAPAGSTFQLYVNDPSDGTWIFTQFPAVGPYAAYWGQNDQTGNHEMTLQIGTSYVGYIQLVDSTGKVIASAHAPLSYPTSSTKK